MLGSACQRWIFPNFQMIQRTSVDETWMSHVKSMTAANNTLTIPQFSSKIVIFEMALTLWTNQYKDSHDDICTSFITGGNHCSGTPGMGRGPPGSCSCVFFFPWVFSGGKHDTSMKLPSFDPYRSLMSTLNVYKWAGCSNLAGWNTEVLVSQCWVEVYGTNIWTSIFHNWYFDVFRDGFISLLIPILLLQKLHALRSSFIIAQRFPLTMAPFISTKSACCISPGVSVRSDLKPAVSGFSKKPFQSIPQIFFPFKPRWAVTKTLVNCCI